ncbi:MAG: response regulator, partial [Verrucomicrobia bacterium]|nr:response regulator [Verrucomicrobiota bacterium]
TFTVRLPYVEPPATTSGPRPAPVPPIQTESRAAGPAPQPATPDHQNEAEAIAPADAAVAAVSPPTHAPGAHSDEWLANLYRRAELFPAITSLHASLRAVETTGNGAPRRILIADDEPDMLRFLRSQLEAHFQVLEAVDGLQAIEKAAQFLPDVILCDMMMPEKDGLQVCRALRERATTRNIPVVLLTARADEETKLAALAAGASDFLTKPFSTTELHVRLKNLVESYQFQRTLARQNQILETTLEQLKDTQAQLVQSEKLASLGRLSAGIIHEINNPLNYASTGLYTLRAKGKHLAPEQLADYEDILRDVEHGLQRVKTIVSDLRSFTHPSHEATDDVPWKDVVELALRFVSHEWKDRVQVQTHIPDHLTVRGNRNKLVQVLVNLLQNALDSLTRKTFAAGGPTLRIEGRQAGAKTELVVRDNGLGIAREHLDKIFDPFFTTKDVGEGMGLGLSICYRIVQEYGGHIRVQSQPGEFCEFTLEFPAAMP